MPPQSRFGGDSPPPCRPDIYERGLHVCILAGPRAVQIEEYVKECAAATGQAVDWHYVGGRANVLTIGDVTKVQDWIREHPRSGLLVGNLPDRPYRSDTQ